MNAGTGFRLHPAAVADIAETWEFKAKDDIATAGKIRDEFLRIMHLIATSP